MSSYILSGVYGNYAQAFMKFLKHPLKKRLDERDTVETIPAQAMLVKASQFHICNP
jgi:hypothetical protein